MYHKLQINQLEMMIGNFFANDLSRFLLGSAAKQRFYWLRINGRVVIYMSLISIDRKIKIETLNNASIYPELRR
jgi:nitric oxide reductase large subunit